MHLPFVMLALATSFLSLVSHSMALSKIEYARHIHALENFGQANGTDPNMATNGTLPDGPPCYEDGIYSAFSAFSSDVVPFCSSFLGIPAITIISACATTTTTFTTITTRTYEQPVYETIPGATTTAQATSTSYFPVAPPSPSPTMEPRDIKNVPKHIAILRKYMSSSDCPANTSISSACSCLRIATGTTSICRTDTKTVTRSGYVPGPSAITVTRPSGTVTVTTTEIIYKPSTVYPTTSSAASSGSSSLVTSTSISSTSKVNITTSINPPPATSSSETKVTTITGTRSSSGFPISSNNGSQSSPSVSFTSESRILTTVTTTGVSGQPTTYTEIIYSNTTITLRSSATTTATVYETLTSPSSSLGTPVSITSTALTLSTGSIIVGSSSGFPSPSVNGTSTPITSSFIVSTSISSISSPTSGFPIPSVNSTVILSTPSLVLSSDQRITTTFITTGASGQPMTITEIIGNNFTETLGYSTTTTITIYVSPSGLPLSTQNSTTLRSTGTAPSGSSFTPSSTPIPFTNSTTSTLSGSPTPYVNSTSSAPSGFPTSYSNTTLSVLSTVLIPTVTTSIVSSTSTPSYSNSTSSLGTGIPSMTSTRNTTTIYSSAPGTAPNIPSTSNLTATLTTTHFSTPTPYSTTAPRSFSYSYSTASDGSVTSYSVPYDDPATSGVWLISYTSAYTTTVITTGTYTSYWTSESPRVRPNGTGSVSYSIPVPTGSRTLDASSDISLSLTTATTVWGINAAVNVEPTPTPTVVVAAESYDSELVAREGGGLQKRTPHVRRFLPVNVW